MQEGGEREVGRGGGENRNNWLIYDWWNHRKWKIFALLQCLMGRVVWIRGYTCVFVTQTHTPLGHLRALTLFNGSMNFHRFRVTFAYNWCNISILLPLMAAAAAAVRLPRLFDYSIFMCMWCLLVLMTHAFPDVLKINVQLCVNVILRWKWKIAKAIFIPAIKKRYTLNSQVRSHTLTSQMKK